MSNQKEVESQILFKKKIQYFFDKNIPIHLKFKLNYFKNGYVTEINNDFFILDDFRDGEIIVFFLELERIEEYKTLGEKNE